MSLAISSVKGKGSLDNERIVLKAKARCEIGEYLICDSTYTKVGHVSNRLRNTYWIPDKIVENGDFVVIYTKSGKPYSADNKAGTKTHCFYWGIERTIWNKEGDCAVLMRIDSWSHKST